MNEEKIIYVCCGTGIATSTVMSKKLKALLDEHKIRYKISQHTIHDVGSIVQIKKPDLIVASTNISGEVDDVPVVIGTAFITGLKKKDTIDKILSILSN